MGRFVVDPLEQFSVILIWYSNKYSTCATTLLVLTFIMFLLIFSVVYGAIKYSYMLLWFNTLVLLSFCAGIQFIIERLLIQFNIFAIYLLFNFIFILLLNTCGMFIFSFTLTSHLSLTFFLSLTYFTGANVVGILLQRQLFLNLFLPKGLPLILTPLLFFLETVSYISRVFSLAIRLFANMLSGHALMKILGGIGWNLLASTHLVLSVLAIFPLLIICGIIGLEFVIAGLQAYVFFVLTLIYTNDFFVSH